MRTTETLTPEQALKELQESCHRLPAHPTIIDLIEGIFPRSHELPKSNIQILYVNSQYEQQLQRTEIGDFCVRIDQGKTYLRVRKTGHGLDDWVEVTDRVDSLSKFPYFVNNLESK